MTRSAVIVDAVRTPSGKGKPGGALSGQHPVDLAAYVMASLLSRSDLESRQLDDVILGCVSQIGDQSINIARQAVLAAGFDESVPATTIDRQCGSSQQAAHFAAQGIMAGAYDVVIAGGVESMSRVPLGSSRQGGTTAPGIRSRYPDGLVNQGVSAELIAYQWDLSREELDAFSAESHRRATDAWAQGRFDSQVLPTPIDEGSTLREDETVRAGTTAAALGGLGAVASVEGVATGAASYRIWIADSEAATHEGIHIVNFGALQVHGAEVVDEDTNTLGLDDFIAFVGRLVDGHAVLETRAAAGGDENAKRVIGSALIGQEVLELGYCVIGHGDHNRNSLRKG